MSAPLIYSTGNTRAAIGEGLHPPFYLITLCATIFLSRSMELGHPVESKLSAT